MVKTHVVKESDITRQWFVVDAAGQTLGRLASKISQILKGKHKPIYSPHLDVGDYVIVINAERIKLTGKKIEQKKYYSHSGYPGGIKEKTMKELLETKPEEIIKKAVWGMIPKNKLGREAYKKLKVYRGSHHPHEAQKPMEYQF